MTQPQIIHLYNDQVNQIISHHPLLSDVFD
jgi:hypothetical protein